MLKLCDNVIVLLYIFIVWRPELLTQQTLSQLEYRMPLDVVQRRHLQATVWNQDTLQENEFLGCVLLPLGSIDLASETVEWYPLGNLQR